MPVVVATDITTTPSSPRPAGEGPWSSLQAAHGAAVTSAAAANGGHVVRCDGAGATLAFPSARAALGAAAAVRHALRRWGHPCVGVAVRIGVHAGPMADAGEEPLGPAVEGAAGIAQLAEPGEVLASAAVRALAAGDRDLPFGPAAVVRVGATGRRFSVAPLLAQRLTMPAARRTTAMHRSST